LPVFPAWAANNEWMPQSAREKGYEKQEEAILQVVRRGVKVKWNCKVSLLSRYAFCYVNFHKAFNV